MRTVIAVCALLLLVPLVTGHAGHDHGTTNQTANEQLSADASPFLIGFLAVYFTVTIGLFGIAVWKYLQERKKSSSDED